MNRVLASFVGAAVLVGSTATGGAPAYSSPEARASTPEVLHFSQRGRPAGVGRRRFVLVLRRAARAWGIRIGPRTRGVAGHEDGVNVVGFSRRLPVRNGGQTRKLTRLVNGRVASQEIDVLLNPGVPWADGPELPATWQWDLISVLYHEFGHVVGARHVRHCRNSPMNHSLKNGEWWRGSGDWFRYRCRNAPGVF